MTSNTQGLRNPMTATSKKSPPPAAKKAVAKPKPKRQWKGALAFWCVTCKAGYTKNECVVTGNWRCCGDNVRGGATLQQALQKKGGPIVPEKSKRKSGTCKTCDFVSKQVCVKCGHCRRHKTFKGDYVSHCECGDDGTQEADDLDESLDMLLEDLGDDDDFFEMPASSGADSSDEEVPAAPVVAEAETALETKAEPITLEKLLVVMDTVSNGSLGFVQHIDRFEPACAPGTTQTFKSVMRHNENAAQCAREVHHVLNVRDGLVAPVVEAVTAPKAPEPVKVAVQPKKPKKTVYRPLGDFAVPRGAVRFGSFAAAAEPKVEVLVEAVKEAPKPVMAAEEPKKVEQETVPGHIALTDVRCRVVAHLWGERSVVGWHMTSFGGRPVGRPMMSYDRKESTADLLARVRTSNAESRARVQTAHDCVFSKTSVVKKVDLRSTLLPAPPGLPLSRPLPVLVPVGKPKRARKTSCAVTGAPKFAIPYQEILPEACEERERATEVAAAPRKWLTATSIKALNRRVQLKFNYRRTSKCTGAHAARKSKINAGKRLYAALLKRYQAWGIETHCMSALLCELRKKEWRSLPSLKVEAWYSLALNRDVLNHVEISASPMFEQMFAERTAVRRDLVRCSPSLSQLLEHMCVRRFFMSERVLESLPEHMMPPDDDGELPGHGPCHFEAVKKAFCGMAPKGLFWCYTGPDSPTNHVSIEPFVPPKGSTYRTGTLMQYMHDASSYRFFVPQWKIAELAKQCNGVISAPGTPARWDSIVLMDASAFRATWNVKGFTVFRSVHETQLDLGYSNIGFRAGCMIFTDPKAGCSTNISAGNYCFDNKSEANVFLSLLEPLVWKENCGHTKSDFAPTSDEAKKLCQHQHADFIGTGTFKGQNCKINCGHIHDDLAGVGFSVCKVKCGHKHSDFVGEDAQKGVLCKQECGHKHDDFTCSDKALLDDTTFCEVKIRDLTIAEKVFIRCWSCKTLVAAHGEEDLMCPEGHSVVVGRVVPMDAKLMSVAPRSWHYVEETHKQYWDRCNLLPPMFHKGMHRFVKRHLNGDVQWKTPQGHCFFATQQKVAEDGANYERKVFWRYNENDQTDPFNHCDIVACGEMAGFTRGSGSWDDLRVLAKTYVFHTRDDDPNWAMWNKQAIVDLRRGDDEVKAKMPRAHLGTPWLPTDKNETYCLMQGMEFPLGRSLKSNGIYNVLEDLLPLNLDETATPQIVAFLDDVRRVLTKAHYSLDKDSVVYSTTWDSTSAREDVSGRVVFGVSDETWSPRYPHDVKIIVPGHLSGKIALAKLRLLPLFLGPSHVIYHTDNGRGKKEVHQGMLDGRKFLQICPENPTGQRICSPTEWGMPAMENVWGYGSACSKMFLRFGNTLSFAADVYGLDECWLYSIGCACITPVVRCSYIINIKAGPSPVDVWRQGIHHSAVTSRFLRPTPEEIASGNYDAARVDTLESSPDEIILAHPLPDSFDGIFPDCSKSVIDLRHANGNTNAPVSHSRGYETANWLGEHNGHRYGYSGSTYVAHRSVSSNNLYHIDDCAVPRACTEPYANYIWFFFDQVRKVLEQLHGKLVPGTSVLVATLDSKDVRHWQHRITFSRQGESWKQRYTNDHQIIVPAFLGNKLAMGKLRLLPYFLGPKHVVYHVNNSRIGSHYTEIAFPDGRPALGLAPKGLVSGSPWNQPAMENVWGYGSQSREDVEHFARTMTYFPFVYGLDELWLFNMGVLDISESFVLGDRVNVAPDTKCSVNYYVNMSLVKEVTWSTFIRPDAKYGERSEFTQMAEEILKRKNWLGYGLETKRAPVKMGTTDMNSQFLKSLIAGSFTPPIPVWKIEDVGRAPPVACKNGLETAKSPSPRKLMSSMTVEAPKSIAPKLAAPQFATEVVQQAAPLTAVCHSVGPLVMCGGQHTSTSILALLLSYTQRLDLTFEELAGVIENYMHLYVRKPIRESSAWEFTTTAPYCELFNACWRGWNSMLLVLFASVFLVYMRWLDLLTPSAKAHRPLMSWFIAQLSSTENEPVAAQTMEWRLLVVVPAGLAKFATSCVFVLCESLISSIGDLFPLWCAAVVLPVLIVKGCEAFWNALERVKSVCISRLSKSRIYVPITDDLFDIHDVVVPTITSPFEGNTSKVLGKDDRREKILVASLGTRGDHMPMLAYAKLFQKHGINVVHYFVRKDDGQDLRDVADGNLWNHLPSFGKTMLVTYEPWKHIYAPFANFNNSTMVAMGNPKKFVPDFKMKTTLLSIGTKIMMRMQIVQYTIGCITGSTIARSHDGDSFILRQNLKPREEKHMWTAGSDDQLKSEFKDIGEEVPMGDHLAHMAKATVIHCHGGAGTMQTAVAAGCHAQSHNDDLDRGFITRKGYDYHLAPSDFKQTSPLPLLVDALFRAGERIPLNWIWACRSELFQAHAVLTCLKLAEATLRLWVMYSIATRYMLVYFAFIATFSSLLRVTYLYMRPLVGFVLYCVWTCPLFFFWNYSGHWAAGLGLIALSAPRVIADLVKIFEWNLQNSERTGNRYLLKFYRLRKDWPSWVLGHTGIYDTWNEVYLEGYFRDGVPEGSPLYHPFNFGRSARRPEEDDCVYSMPVYVSEDLVRFFSAGNTWTNAYSAWWNCQHMTWQLIKDKHLLILVPFIALFISGLWTMAWYMLFEHFKGELVFDTAGFRQPEYPLLAFTEKNDQEVGDEWCHHCDNLVRWGSKCLGHKYYDMHLSPREHQQIAQTGWSSRDASGRLVRKYSHWILSNERSTALKRAWPKIIPVSREEAGLVGGETPASEEDYVCEHNVRKKCLSCDGGVPCCDLTFMRCCTRCLCGSEHDCVPGTDSSEGEGKDSCDMEPDVKLELKNDTEDKEKPSQEAESSETTSEEEGDPYENPYESLNDLLESLGCLSATIVDGLVMDGYNKTEVEDTVMEACMNVLANEITKVRIPAEIYKMVDQKNAYLALIPQHIQSPWEKFQFAIRKGTEKLYHIPFVRDVVSWLAERAVRWNEFAGPVLRTLLFVGTEALKVCRESFEWIASAMNTYLDMFWSPMSTRRAKAVWMLSNLTQTPFLSATTNILADISRMEFEGRKDLWTQFHEYVEEIERHASKFGVEIPVGGPQRRKVHWKDPVMNPELARMLGFSPDNADDQRRNRNVEWYNDRISKYLNNGVDQGADGVFLGQLDPQIIERSIKRYGPNWQKLSRDDEAFAKEVADALAEKFPEAYKDCKPVPFKAVLNYLKKDYSAGVFHIGNTRKALIDNGLDEVMLSIIQERFRSGKYPAWIGHAFVKSQVVKGRVMTGFVSDPVPYAYDTEKPLYAVSIPQDNNRRGLAAAYPDKFVAHDSLFSEERLKIIDSDLMAGGARRAAAIKFIRSRPLPEEYNGKVLLTWREETSPIYVRQNTMLEDERLDAESVASLEASYHRKPNWYATSSDRNAHLILELEEHITNAPSVDEWHRKNARTVVAERLETLLMNGIMELGRNKRITWPTTGVAAGMPLNQTLLTLFNQMRNQVSLRGGHYFNADASEFDSRTRPFLWSILKNLSDIGYQDQTFGDNAKTLMRAKYDALQEGWICGITEPEFDALALAVPSDNAREMLLKQFPDTFSRTPAEGKVVLFKNVEEWEAMPHAEQNKCPFRGIFIKSDDLEKYQLPNGVGRYATFVHDTLYQLEEEAYGYARAFQEGWGFNWHAKNRGGATGQSATSWDNSHGFRGVLVAAICRYYDYALSPKEVLDHFIITNTGDDTSGAVLHLSRDAKKRLQELGLPTTAPSPHGLHKAMAHYGIFLEIEYSDDFYDLEYLGKKVRKATDEDIETLKVWQRYAAEKGSHGPKGELPPLPTDVIFQDTKAIILRRTGFRYYQSTHGGPLDKSMDRDAAAARLKAVRELTAQGFTRTNDPQYDQRLGAKVLRLFKTEPPRVSTVYYESVARNIGHAMVCAFLPEVYKLTATEYCEDMNRLNAAFKLKSKYQLTSDDDGLPIVKFVQMDGPLSPRQAALRGWQVSQKFPTYAKVIQVHMAPPILPQTKYEQFLRKISKGGVYSQDEVVRFGVDIASTWIRDIPRQWYKMVANQTATHPEPVFPVYNHWICKFIHRRHSPESFADLSSLVRESPFGMVVDAGTHWQKYWTDEVYQEECDAHPVWVYQNMAVIQTLLYLAMYPLEKFIISLAFIGVFYRVFLFMMIDMPKLYAVANVVFWLSAARSSREISSLIPRDPYMYSKRFVAWVNDSLPIWLGYALPFHLILDMLPKAIDLISRMVRKGGTVRAFDGADGVSKNPWLPDAEQWMLDAQTAIMGGKDFRGVVGAPTATGKSTWFIWALLTVNPFRRFRPNRVWLVVPRRILRKVYEGAIPALRIQKLTREDHEVHPDAQIIVCTYGHFINRYADIREGDIFCFDEFHEESGEMIQASFDLEDHQNEALPEFFRKPNVVLYLSATAPARAPTVSKLNVCQAGPNVKQRHATTVYERDADVLDNYVWAAQHFPEAAKNCLMIVPQRQAIPGIIEGLENLKPGVPIVELSAITVDRPLPTGECIIVATQIVDAGITLPNVQLLIDSGTEVQVHQGQFVKIGGRLPPACEATSFQRKGRVGRKQDGIVVRPVYSGTGIKPTNYPSPGRFTHPKVAQWFNMPMLQVLEHHSNDRCPYYDMRLVEKAFWPEVQALIHFSLAGIASDEWLKYYQMLKRGQRLPEEFDIVHRYTDRRHQSIKAGYADAMRELMKGQIVWKFGDAERIGSVFYPIKEQWRPFTATGDKYWNCPDNSAPPPNVEGDLRASLEKKQLEIMSKAYIAMYCGCGRKKNALAEKCSFCDREAAGGRVLEKSQLHKKIRKAMAADVPDVEDLRKEMEDKIKHLSIYKLVESCANTFIDQAELVVSDALVLARVHGWTFNDACPQWRQALSS